MQHKLELRVLTLTDQFAALNVHSEIYNGVLRLTQTICAQITREGERDWQQMCKLISGLFHLKCTHKENVFSWEKITWTFLEIWLWLVPIKWWCDGVLFLTPHSAVLQWLQACHMSFTKICPIENRGQCILKERFDWDQLQKGAELETIEREREKWKTCGNTDKQGWLYFWEGHREIKCV